MKIRFWGTRGSIAKPGPSTIRYGGNTSCVEVRLADGTLIVLDCGTGAHGLGQALLADPSQPRRGHILLTHTHWDHIQGIPFFVPLFLDGWEWDVYGPRGLGQSIRNTLRGQMQDTYFPVTLDQLGAKIQYHDLVEGLFEIGGVRIRARYLNHPALCLGYRLEADGAALVYATDHEPFSRGAALGAASAEIRNEDLHHAEFMAGADLLIHDSQYTAGEYPARVGWGHSTVEYVVDLARSAGVGKLALYHHDPLRDDAAVDRLLESARQRAGDDLEVIAAAEGLVVEVEGDASRRRDETSAQPSAVADPPELELHHSVLLAVSDPASARALSEAVRADDVRVLTATDAGIALEVVKTEQPSLLILERALPGRPVLDLCRAIRSETGAYGEEVPIVIVVEKDDPDEPAAAEAAGVTDWLRKPFSVIYARTRIRCWLLRMAFRWKPAPLPHDEAGRLAVLRRLGILDTEREERFDRITRLASALFGVPIALVSLVDAERQWFKSAHGTDVRETPRDMAFCGHAILGDEVLVVPDALLDPRFADNPVSTGEARVRFYAGYPLSVEGHRVGTLCLVDHRPRDLDEVELRLLRDLGELARRELQA